MPAAAKTHVDLMFRAFSDPIRLRILSLVQPGELCVCDLVEILRLPQPTISRASVVSAASGAGESAPGAIVELLRDRAGAFGVPCQAPGLPGELFPRCARDDE